MTIDTVVGMDKIVQGIRDHWDQTDSHNYAPEAQKLARRNFVRYMLGYRPDYRKQAQYAASYGGIKR